MGHAAGHRRRGLLLVGSWLTGVNLFDVVGGGGGAADVVADRPAASSPEEERLVDFVDAVMGDIQHTWSQGCRNYQPTRAVLFRDSIQSACGLSSSATGPFYCPGDRKVYLDLGFFDDLHQKLGAPGDFAQAYVLAHEVGHHVQNLTGSLDGEPFRGNANERSVRVELQADCYAGVWGHEAAKPGRFAAGRVELDPGDVEEGLNAAAAIGDDRLQKRSQGRVVARVVHPRDLRATGDVVQARHGDRRPARVRYVCDTRNLDPMIHVAASTGSVAGIYCRRNSDSRLSMKITMVINDEHLEDDGRHLPNPLNRREPCIDVALNERIRDDRLRRPDMGPAAAQRVPGNLRHGEQVQHLQIEVSERARGEVGDDVVVENCGQQRGAGELPHATGPVPSARPPDESAPPSDRRIPPESAV